MRLVVLEGWSLELEFWSFIVERIRASYPLRKFDLSRQSKHRLKVSFGIGPRKDNDIRVREGE